MIVYRTLRSLALWLRGVQTALLAATFIVSDYAEASGAKAKDAAHKSLDRKIEAGYTRVDNLFAAAEFARARAEDAADDWASSEADHNGRRAMIEREVL